MAICQMLNWPTMSAMSPGARTWLSQGSKIPIDKVENTLNTVQELTIDNYNIK
jgi:hypothetical protein